MKTSQIVQGPFGSEIVPVRSPELDAQASGPSATRGDSGGQLVTATDETFRGQPMYDAARAVREGTAAEEYPSFVEALGAGIRQWDTTKLINRLIRPTFEDDTPINAGDFLNQLDFVPTEDESEYIVDAANRGMKSAEYALNQVREIRQAQQVTGHRPGAALLAAFADPVWFAIPPAVRMGKTGRVGSAVAGAGIQGGLVAAGEGPTDTDNVIVNMLFGGALGAVAHTQGKGLRPTDPNFPADRLNTLATEIAEGVVRPAPDTGKVPWARGLMWNMHKTMSNFGPVGQRVADTLFDNNLNLGVNSLESHREMILSALRPKQFEYEDMLREEIGRSGLGTFSQINPFRARQYLDEQRRIEKAVQRELYRRDQMTRLGRDIADPTVPAAITRMADALDEMHRIALKEMQAAGVEGAENLVERPGYLHRKWSPTQIDAAMRRLMDKGMNERQAREQLWSLVAMSFRRANGMDADTAQEIAQAVIDRAIRKGVGEDPFVSAPGASAVMAQTRDRMRADGIPERAIERYLEFFKASDDEAGKAGMLKRRMDLDYRAQIRVDGETISVMDLLDENLTTTIEQYVKQTSTAVAFARKGLTKRSDIEAMRRELAESLPPQSPEQLEALALFDNAVAALRGEPSGQAMNDTFRLFQTYGRSIALAWSGLWQFTEYATAMAEYGLGKTLKYAVQEIPGMRSIVRPSADEAKQLVDLLSDHSAQSLRLRPFISRFDDGYDMNTQSVAQLIGQTAGQMVPYANGMKFVHHHQARTVGNLVVDRLRLAANGDGKAREALAKYGIEAPVMDKLRAEIAAHGMAVDRWSDDVWMSVRPALGKMMDEAVLRGRLGDIPAWAAFDNVGKFLFTYRTFVLNAHNKILAGRAARDGHAGYGLIMLYQFPLAMAAVQAQSIVRGQGAMEDDELVKATISQMGAIGLFSEPFKWATGQSNSIGAVGLLPADRAIRLGQSALDGDADKFTSNLLTVLPVVSANPIMNSISHQLKE